MTNPTCPSCGQQVSTDDKFCIYCGASLSGISSPEEEPATPSPEHAEPATIRQEIGRLQQELQEAGLLLDRLMERLVAIQRAQSEQPGQPPRPEPTSTPTPPLPPLANSVSRLAARAAAFSRANAARTASPPRTDAGVGAGHSGTAPPSFGGLSFDWIERIDWEEVLGRNWFAIIGAIALAIGMGFFLKLAIDNEWIGETGRILVGIGAGLALIVAGWYAQPRYPLWAQPVTGGGLTILYLSIYAAFDLYDLIDVVPALLYLALVVVLGVALALRYESLVIALLGIVGAFLAPVLLGAVLGPDLAEADLPDEHWLLIYVLVVGAGVLAVSTFRNWRWLTAVGMVGSYGVLILWADNFPDRNAVLAQLAISGVLLEFIGATTLFHILWRRNPDPLDLALMTVNAAAFYGLTFVVMWDQYQDWFGLITLGLSLLYGLVAFAAWRRSGTLDQVALFALSIAVVFLTIAVPVQLTGKWISAAWATEGAVITAIGLYIRSDVTRAFALGILATAVVRLLIFDTQVNLEGFQPVLNERFPTFAVAIAAVCLAAFLFWRQRDTISISEANIYLVLIVVANFITLWLLSAEAIAYFESREIDFFRVEDSRHMTLTALWAVYAAGLVVVAMARRSRALRWGALVLLAAPVIKLLLVDTLLIETDPLTFQPVINFGFLTFVVVLSAVLAAAYTYRRLGEHLEAQERLIFPVLLLVSSAVSLWVFSAETVRFFDARAVRLGTETTSQMHLTLTVLWALYAVGIMVVGVIRKSSQVRLAGIVLMVVPVLKLFLYDTFLLERGYRVAAFITLGGLLLSVGLMYQRYSQAVRGFLFGRPG